jgi:hypothetical protein
MGSNERPNLDDELQAADDGLVEDAASCKRSSKNNAMSSLAIPYR